jgi:hypothetical protein
MIGRIYKIQGNDKFYIGSTTCDLKYRLKKHRSKSKEEVSINNPLYKYFRVIGWENASITLIKEVQINTKKELLEIEKSEILQVKHDLNCLNSNMPILTLEEKKKRDSEYSKLRRQANPERERERLQKWRKENPEKRREQTKREREKKNIL